MLLIPASGAPAYASGEAPAQTAEALARTQSRIEVFAPRVRRSAVMYLRLRLLELREEGLDRARAVIEHRLSVDELLAPPTPAPRVQPAPARPQQPKRAEFKKAQSPLRRTDGP